MPFLIKIKGADFSAIKVATVYPSTSITSGLQSYYRMLNSVEESRLDYQSDTYDAYVTGTPTASSFGMLSNGSNNFLFGSKPGVGSRTIAVILKGQSTSSGVTYPLASYNGSPTTNGAEYFDMNDLVVSWVGTMFNGSTYSTNLSLGPFSMVMDRYDLIVVRLTEGVGGNLVRPRDGLTRTASNTVDTFSLPNPGNYGTGTIGYSPLTSMSMFAHWNRALTDEEVYTFYAEQQFNFANLSL